MFWHSSKSRIIVGDEMENENICSEKLSNDLTRQFIANPISSRKNTKVVIKDMLNNI